MHEPSFVDRAQTTQEVEQQGSLQSLRMRSIADGGGAKELKQNLALVLERRAPEEHMIPGNDADLGDLIALLEHLTAKVFEPLGQRGIVRHGRLTVPALHHRGDRARRSTHQ